MKKITTAADLGGGPFYKSDLRQIFSGELWDVIEAYVSPFLNDTEGIIMTGGVISGSGPYSMTAAIVNLNGEFMRLPAQSSFTLPQYIQPDTPINDNRTFADSTVNTVAITKNAKISSTAPGSGQYIAITSATDPDDRRWSNMLITGTTRLFTKVISMTLWNMNTTPLKTYAHGLSAANKIISIKGNIFLDSGTLSIGGGIGMKAIDLDMADVGPGTDTYPAATKWGCVRGWNDTAVELWANPYRAFGTNSAFSGTGFRGYLYITYIP